MDGPPYAALALSLVGQPWPDLGLDLDLLNDPPSPSPSSSSSSSAAAGARGVASGRRTLGVTPPSSETDDISPIVDRIVSLLLVRIVALVNTSDAYATAAAAAAAANTPGIDGAVAAAGGSGVSGGSGDSSSSSEHRYSLVNYPDLSTTTIARTELGRAAASTSAASAASTLATSTSASTACAAHAWPQPSITAEVMRQLREYVHRICSDYRAVHYHNVEHCYHVTLSASKLLDMMLCERQQQQQQQLEEEEEEDDDMQEGAGAAVSAGVTTTTTTTTTTEAFRERQQRRRRQQRDNDANAAAARQHRGKNTKKRKLYGLRNDALTHLAFVFSALIHDVDHTGITNRQLVDEADELALLYNDQSVAEQRSLAVAFSTLLSPDFDRLRDVMFATREDYKRFRGVVIDLVLTTDIASPERTQIVKSKWKEAFPSAAQAARTKQWEEQRRRSSMAASSAIHHRRQHSIDGGGVAATCMMHSPPQIVERVGEEGGEGGEEESDETELLEKEDGAQLSLLANLRKRAGGEVATDGNDADRCLGAGDTFAAPLKGCDGDTDEDEIGRHDRKMRTAAPSALRSSRHKSSKSSECSSARVSIVDPLQAEQTPVLRRADSTSSVRSDGTTSLPGDETPQPQTLKSSFFRGRVSMGLGYLKGETGSVSARRLDVNRTAKEIVNTRMSLTVQSGGQPLVPQSHCFSADSQEQSSSFQSDEEEDEISSDGDSVSTTSSSPSVACGEDDAFDESHDVVVVSGVTVSKLDLEERDTFDQSASAGTGPASFRHRAKSVGDTHEKQKGIHPSIQRAMNDVNRGQRWKRAASDRKLLPSPLQEHSEIHKSRSKGSADGRQDLRSKLVRRFSLPSMSKAPKYELRLGIRRAVDLTGQPIETYAPRPAIKRRPSRDSLDIMGDVDDESEEEEYDELKVQCILEHLMKAADVAALMQSFDNLNKWSSRLYREQKASAVVARGDDPDASWFEGQIVFMDIYVMPLARKLAEPGIFDDETGKLFAQCVQDNRARWLIEGQKKTENLKANWNEKHMKA